MDEQGVPGPRSESTVAATVVPHLFTAQQTALAEMMRAMDSGARWVVLIGDDGSGKSTVIRALLDELRLTAASVVVLGAANAGDADLLADGVRHQLGLPPSRGRNLLGAGRSISEILGSQAARGTPLVVIVDDANALPGASVKWLARLAASASRSQTVCYVVLAGTNALDKPAGRAWARAHSGGQSVRSELGPLTTLEIQRYVEHCAAEAAVKFSEGAIRGIELYSKGRPGRIAQLCARSVTLPGTRITSQVSAEAVAETAERLGFSGASAAGGPRSKAPSPSTGGCRVRHDPRHGARPLSGNACWATAHRDVISGIAEHGHARRESSDGARCPLTERSGSRRVDRIVRDRKRP
jgi:type II secretory pathway predicted ATPase ExeA